MAENITCVSIYPSSATVELALGELQTAGCDLRQVSIIGRGCHAKTQSIGFYSSEGRIQYKGRQSVFWDTLCVSLADAAFFWMPDLGPLLVVGRIVTFMVRGMEDVELASGFSILGAALFVIGIPRNNINEYEQAIKDRKFLLLVHGQRQDVEYACEILHSETQQVAVHSA